MSDELGRLAAIVAAGGVIAVPTDTVHGIACDPANVRAVSRVYDIKGRPGALELPVLAAGREDLHGLVVMTAAAGALAERFWPGPLTVVVPVGPRRLAVPRQGSTLAVRVPAHDRLRELLRLTGPLAVTSANRHGQRPATTAGEVREQLGGSLDGVLDGPSGGGRSSTIIDGASTPPRLIREGPIGVAELSPYLGGAQPSQH